MNKDLLLLLLLLLLLRSEAQYKCSHTSIHFLCKTLLRRVIAQKPTDQVSLGFAMNKSKTLQP